MNIITNMRPHIVVLLKSEEHLCQHIVCAVTVDKYLIPKNLTKWSM